MTDRAAQSSNVQEIEITPEMAQAGGEALRVWFGEPGEPLFYLRDAAEAVFRAMLKQSPNSASHGS